MGIMDKRKIPIEKSSNGTLTKILNGIWNILKKLFEILIKIVKLLLK